MGGLCLLGLCLEIPEQTRELHLHHRYAGKLNSTGQRIQMTDITAKVENGKISIPLNVVKEKKIVRFRIRDQRGQDTTAFLCVTDRKSGYSRQCVRTLPVDQIPP